jgi:hypothetical protein
MEKHCHHRSDHRQDKRRNEFTPNAKDAMKAQYNKEESGFEDKQSGIGNPMLSEEFCFASKKSAYSPLVWRRVPTHFNVTPPPSLNIVFCPDTPFPGALTIS